MNTNLSSVYKIKQGDIATFKSLYLEYYKKLCFHSFKITNRNDIAEEIVQDVFVKIWEKREKLNLSDNIGSYLYRAVLNESLNFLKKQKYDTYDENSIQNLKNLSNCHEMEVNQNEIRKEIRKAIKKLPDKTRRVFIMSRKLELSYQDIADRLNISIKGVEYHICKALKLLREDLNSTLFLLFFMLFTMVSVACIVITI
ncbi:RNA polymerase sigma-70 factor [Labilibaculum euxinus]